MIEISHSIPELFIIWTTTECEKNVLDSLAFFRLIPVHDMVSRVSVDQHVACDSVSTLMSSYDNDTMCLDNMDIEMMAVPGNDIWQYAWIHVHLM